MRISDWSSDVCSSDLAIANIPGILEYCVSALGRAAGEHDDAAAVEARLNYMGNAIGLGRRVKTLRSEERRVGKECVGPCRSRRSSYHQNKQTLRSHKS